MGVDSGEVFLTLKGKAQLDYKMAYVECERKDTHTEVIFRLSANFELPDFFKTYTQEELESYIVLLGRVMLDARKDAEKRSQSNDINIIEQTIQLLNTNKKDETIKNYDSLLKEKQHIIDQLTKDKDDLSRRFDKDKDDLSRRFDKDKEHFIKSKEEIIKNFLIFMLLNIIQRKLYENLKIFIYLYFDFN